MMILFSLSFLLLIFNLQALTDDMLTELKSCFLEAYDDNQDGKIDIRELAQLLPMEENFLLLFRFDNPLESSVEFMKIWREYDSDNSGYIEADELKVSLNFFIFYYKVTLICFNVLIY
jgi:Ca2+-binding EF-hand superfamily protein